MCMARSPTRSLAEPPSATQIRRMVLPFMIKRKMTRRGFVKSVGAAGAFMIVPRHVLGQGQVPPSEKLNVACIGLGWPGRKDTDALAATDNIVALCDVDEAREPDFRKKYEK